MAKQDENLYKAVDAIRRKFLNAFYPEHLKLGKNPFGIAGTGYGGDNYDGKTATTYLVFRVTVSSDADKERLTAELKKRDSTHDFLYFAGAEIEIVVGGEYLLASKDKGA